MTGRTQDGFYYAETPLRYEYFDRWIYTRSPLILAEQRELYMRSHPNYLLGDALATFVAHKPPEQALLEQIWHVLFPLPYVGRYRVERKEYGTTWKIACETLRYEWCVYISLEAILRALVPNDLLCDMIQHSYDTLMREHFATLERHDAASPREE